MKKIVSFLLLFTVLLSFADAQVLQGTSTILIPSGGGTNTLPNYQITKQINLTTNGSVTLSTGYTLAYTSLPSVGVGWTVYCDFSNLNANGQTVTVFGRQPLVEYPGIAQFNIYFWVAPNGSGTPTLYYVYTQNAIAPGGNVNTPITFRNDVTFRGDSVHLQVGDTTLPILTGASVISINSRGTLGFGCPSCSWNILGNNGLSRLNFIGNIDTPDLRFKVNNQPSGIISYNTACTALGNLALFSNTTGLVNTAFGSTALGSNTTGSRNTAVGGSALISIVTGSRNTAIGYGAGNNANGSFNTFLGYNATPADPANNNAVAIGNNAVAGNNECQISGVQRLTFPGMNTSPGYVLTDSAGAYVPRPAVFTTPIIDTVTGTSSQTFTLSNNQTNILTASTTVAGATLAFPAVQSGTIVVIWKIQTTTTAASGTNTSTISIPSTVAAGVSRTFVCTSGNWY